MEDKPHIVLCCRDGADEQWQASLKKMKTWLWEQNTNSALSDTLIEGLERWCQDPTAQSKNYSMPAAKLQSKIRWGHVLDGWLVTGWRENQAAVWLHA